MKIQIRNILVKLGIVQPTKTKRLLGQLQRTTEALKAHASVQFKRAEALRIKSQSAHVDANHAQRVADKLSGLLS